MKEDDLVTVRYGVNAGKTGVVNSVTYYGHYAMCTVLLEDGQERTYGSGDLACMS